MLNQVLSLIIMLCLTISFSSCENLKVDERDNEQEQKPTTNNNSDEDNSIDFSSNHRVFITSTSMNGNLGGINGADSICQSHATSAGITGSFKALITDNVDDDIFARLTFSGKTYVLDSSDNPIQVTADLDSSSSVLDIDSQLITAIDYDENGNSLGGVSIWTGFGSDGTNIGSAHCANWTDDGSSFESGVIGGSDQLDDALFDSANDDCNQLHHLLCISQ